MEEIAEFCVKLAGKSGAEYAEARFEASEGSHYVMNNGIVNASGIISSKGIGLRILKGKAMAFGSTNKLDKANLKKFVADLIKSINSSKSLSMKTELSKEKTTRKKYDVKQRIKLLDIGPGEKIGVLKDISSMVTASGISNKMKANCYIYYSDLVKKKITINSEGSKVVSTIPLVELFYILSLQHGNKATQRMWQMGNSGGYEQVRKWKAHEHIEAEVSSLIKVLNEGKRPKKGVYDFIVSPEIAGIMAHESGGHPYEADRILGREAAQAGESFIEKGMIGTKIGSDAVSVVDDPTIEGSYGFYLYDDECVKGRKKYLLKKGVINEFMHGRESAKLFETSSNGCARASSYNREPLVRMSNTYIEPGDHNDEELFQGVKNGIYMKSFMEWNIDDKRLNQKYVGAESYFIKNGKITGPCLKPALEITTPKLYSSIDAVGKNLEFHPGSCGKGEPMQGMPVWLGGATLRVRGVRMNGS